MSTQEIAKWESGKGISSLRKKFEGLAETDETLPNPVDVPHFAAIINKDGVFAIGDEIHVITYENEYVIKNNDQTQLQNILNNNIQVNPNVKSVKITRKILSSTSLDPNAMASLKETVNDLNTVMWTGDRSATEPSCNANGRDERVKLEAFVNNYASYGIIGVRIIGEAYRAGGVFGSKAWRFDEVHYGKIEGIADFTYAGGLLNMPFSVEGGGDEVRKTIFDYYTTPFYSSLNANYIDATYTYQKNPVCSTVVKFIRHQ